MRHLVFALILALLPLRGWVADAMGMEMSVQKLQLAQAAADAPAVSMPADCPMHQEAGAQGGDASTSSQGAPCQSCDSCELCLPLTLAGSTAAPAPPSWPQAAPAGGGTRFASAERAARFRPPIS